MINLLFIGNREHKEQPNYQGYKRNIYQRKHGVNESIKKLKHIFAAAEIDNPLIISLCLHKDQKWKEEVDSTGQGKQRY